jgi:LuxR family transcriptional regulator, csgAB operon transcriptional regulatory protein
MANLKNPDALSTDEIKVLIATCQGFSNTEIAKSIYKSQHSVDRHRKHLYRKLHVRNKQEFVTVASKLFRLV